MTVYERALMAIYGTVPDELWEQVASGEIAPPWPLPEVMEWQGLRVGKTPPPPGMQLSTNDKRELVDHIEAALKKLKRAKGDK